MDVSERFPDGSLYLKPPAAKASINDWYESKTTDSEAKITVRARSEA